MERMQRCCVVLCVACSCVERRSHAAASLLQHAPRRCQHKQEKLERAANFARVMEELAQLGAFVRLCDYLLVEGVVSCALASVEELLALLTAHKQQVRARAGRVRMRASVCHCTQRLRICSACAQRLSAPCCC